MTWSYRFLIAISINLAENTRQDIEYSVHQYARFQCNPKLHHANAFKRIVRYSLGTKDQGVSFTPNGDVTHFECYVDADFAGNYTQIV